MTLDKIAFRTGERIFVPGGSGAPGSIGAALFAEPGLRITTSYVPGVNRLDAEHLGRDSVISGLFMFPALADAQRSGAFRHLPMSYGATSRWLQEQEPHDSCIVQVSTPGSDGRVSLGPAAEFTPGVLRRARRIIAVVNPRVPKIVDAPSLALRDCAVILQQDEPLTCYGAGEVDAVSARVAARVAPLISDGNALQLGLGKVPSALTRFLRDRRGLRLHSGMLSDGLMDLAASGALAPDWQHVTTMLLGSARLYEWSAQQSSIRLRGCEYTHDAGRLAAIGGFISVNTALSVDLFGQCNLETASGRALSGAGGAPDFARAARLSPGGLSIVALPAAIAGNQGSRIVAKLCPGSVVTLPRTDVDIVVTDEGTADLRGRSVPERAEALIAVAPPAARAELSDQWREILARL
jgi:acyl-CoA hydrolase